MKNVTKILIGVNLFCAGIIVYAIIDDSKTKAKIKIEAQQAGINPADLIGEFANKKNGSVTTLSNNTYSFKDEENRNDFDKFSNFQCKSILLCERTRTLDLSWYFYGTVFLASDPTVSVESPTTDQAIIVQGNLGPLPTSVKISGPGSGYQKPNIILKLESAIMQPHVVCLRLDNMQFAKVRITSSNAGVGFVYDYFSIKPLIINLFLE